MDFYLLPKEWLGFKASSTRVFYAELQLNEAEYQLQPKNTSTQHIYVLIQYSMYVCIYMHKYVYVTL